MMDDAPTYTRVEDHAVAVPDDLGHGLGVGHAAGDLHLLVLLHLHLGARQVVQDLDAGGRHCNGKVQIFLKYTKYFSSLTVNGKPGAGTDGRVPPAWPHLTLSTLLYYLNKNIFHSINNNCSNHHLALVLGLVCPGGVDELEVVAVVRVVSEHEVAVEAGEVAVKPCTQQPVRYNVIWCQRFGSRLEPKY